MLVFGGKDYYVVSLLSGMGLCNTVIDNPPDPFFMVDCYRYHDKYVITKNEEWLGFAEVDVQEISNTMA